MKNTKKSDIEQESQIKNQEEENQFYHHAPSTIRMIRESNGLSQKYVADKLEITQQQYSNIEKHPENTSLKRFKELSAVFKVPVTTLIGETENYIQQNFQQQGRQAATVLNNTGLPDKERELYERMIIELKEQITLLKAMLSSKNEGEK